MATDKASTKKPPSPRDKCTSCNHPKPFHKDGLHKCRAFSCACKRFRKSPAKAA